MPYAAAQLIGFLAGLLLGSFLNVCISRLPRGESIAKPASHCPVCKHPIRWYDNIPLLSWLVLKGHCRDCKAAISWRYPAVELAYGLWAVLTVNRWVLLEQLKATSLSGPTTGNYIELAVFAIVGFLLIGLLVMDWQTHRLPDAFTLTGIFIALLLVCLQTIFLEPGEHQIIFAFKHLRLASPGSFAARGNVFLTGPEAVIFGRMAAICGVALLLVLIRVAYKALRKREGLGLGDVKLIAMIAAFLGFWPAILTLFVGTLLATVYAVFLLAGGRANTLTRLPLGSFLCAAGLFTALFGQQIIAWYTPYVTF
jgi:leader peptidase (prepilin peptidase)/N-methyltransferase